MPHGTQDTSTTPMPHAILRTDSTNDGGAESWSSSRQPSAMASIFLWRMIALAALVPCGMMAGVFVAMVDDYGVFSVPTILLNPDSFVHQYAFILWFVGLWSCFALLNAVGLGLILIVLVRKSGTKRVPAASSIEGNE